MTESPFDPFNFGDDDDDERLVSPATTSAAKASIDTGGSTSTSRTTNKDRTETAGDDELKAVTEDTPSKPIAPRLNVRLTLHEEVSSSATVDRSSDGGSLSSLFIEGKVMVRIEC
jgi:hypothetical protein